MGDPLPILHLEACTKIGLGSPGERAEWTRWQISAAVFTSRRDGAGQQTVENLQPTGANSGNTPQPSSLSINRLEKVVREDRYLTRNGFRFADALFGTSSHR